MILCLATARVERFRAGMPSCNASETRVGQDGCVSDTALRLRATSDALMRDLEALGALEEEKRTVAAADPRRSDLARRIHEIAGRVLQRTADQEALTEQAVAAPTAPHDPPIDDVVRSPAAILAEWRAAEQRAAVVDPDAPEAIEVRILARRLREEYRAAFEARQEE